MRQWGWVLSIGLATFLAVPLALAEPAYEREQLHLILGQLDRLEALARRSQEALPPQQSSRYRFDYAQLQQDIQQVRLGINGYLSPERQQPRVPLDFPELSGNYRIDSRAISESRSVEKTTP